MKLNETCANCGLKVKKEHRTNPEMKHAQYADPCLGILPGVKFGCCGHGARSGYLFFENGVRVGMSVIEVSIKTVSKYHKFNEQTTLPKEN